MDKGHTITAPHDFEVGDRVRIVTKPGQVDWCNVEGVIGTIGEQRTHYRKPGMANYVRLVKVIPDDENRIPIIVGVDSIVRIATAVVQHPTWALVGPLNKEDYEQQRAFDEAQAKSLGFDSPDDPRYAEWEGQMSFEHSAEGRFPVDTRVLVTRMWDDKVIGEGTVTGHVEGLVDHGGPEDGPGPVEEETLCIVKLDDGKEESYPCGQLSDKTCPECGSLVDSRDAHTGYDPTTVYICRNKDCGWKDMA